MLADTLGWLGSLCFGVCGIPQALKARRDGHADGLSWWFLVAWMGGEILYITATLMKFGPVWWMLANYTVNTVALCVILRYKARPKGWRKWCMLKDSILLQAILDAKKKSIMRFANEKDMPYGIDYWITNKNETPNQQTQ